MGVHTSKNYEVELENLRTRVMTMGGRVESQVRLAILSLILFFVVGLALLVFWVNVDRAISESGRSGATAA